MRSIRLCFMIGLMFQASTASAGQVIINGPAGSGTFGTTVTVLPNRNFVVTDPTYSIPGGAQNVGAAYLYAIRAGRIEHGPDRTWRRSWARCAA